MATLASFLGILMRRVDEATPAVAALCSAQGGGAVLGRERRRKGSRGARGSRRRSFKGAEPLALRGTHAKAKPGGGGAGRVGPSLSWPDGPRRA
jgi:hypothetical protein